MATMQVGPVPAHSSFWYRKKSTHGARAACQPAVTLLVAFALSGARSGPGQSGRPRGATHLGRPRLAGPDMVRSGRDAGIITPFMVLYALHDAMVKPMPGKPLAPSLAEYIVDNFPEQQLVTGGGGARYALYVQHIVPWPGCRTTQLRRRRVINSSRLENVAVLVMMTNPCCQVHRSRERHAALL